jgi:hypothetical protein
MGQAGLITSIRTKTCHLSTDEYLLSAIMSSADNANTESVYELTVRLTVLRSFTTARPR